MPTYEYKREDGTFFEYTQSINEDALKTCPTTGLAVKRIISGGGGVVYKGSGWYITDYKNGKGENNTNGASTNEKPAETTKPDNSAEKSA
jgi:putative FmdB family regulatory protein